MRRHRLLFPVALAALAGALLLVPSALAGARHAGARPDSGWNADAKSLRGRNGERFTFTCPAGGAPLRVWGTTVYTDDSSVCTAAVHAGRITFTRGGTVTIEVRAGQSNYFGSTSSGVTTRSYGPWAGSFVIVGWTRG